MRGEGFTKAIILCGGEGTRLKPFTFSRPKQLLPLANRILIAYVIDSVKSCGIDELCLVVNHYNRKIFEQTLKNGASFGVRITYILQEQAKGIAHALSLCEDWTAGDKFLLYLGDNLLEENLESMKSLFLSSQAQATILLKEVEDPRAFGVATLQDGRIVRLVEKPKEPESRNAVLGLYFFDFRVFDVIRRLKPSWRGEYEITDAISLLIEEGNVVNYHFLKGWWKDTGKVPDLLDANRRILSSRPVEKAVQIELEHSFLGEDVSVGENCTFLNCRIEGPTVIGHNAKFQNVTIGPYTAIGNDCVLEHVELENSILMDRVRLSNLSVRMKESILGCDFEWSGTYPDAGVVQIVAGDHNKISFY